MQAEKQLQRRLVGLRYRTLVGQPGSSSENPSDESGSVESRLAKLIGLQELEMTERRVFGIQTWPFDIQVVGKFVTIVLSITAVLLSRVIAAFLHI